jgi:hypothetical protein
MREISSVKHNPLALVICLPTYPCPFPTQHNSPNSFQFVTKTRGSVPPAGNSYIWNPTHFKGPYKAWTEVHQKVTRKQLQSLKLISHLLQKLILKILKLLQHTNSTSNVPEPCHLIIWGAPGAKSLRKIRKWCVKPQEDKNLCLEHHVVQKWWCRVKWSTSLRVQIRFIFVSQHFRRTGTVSTLLWTLVCTSQGNVSWDMDITTNVVSEGRIQQLQQTPSAIKKDSFPGPPTCLTLSHTCPFLNPKQWGPNSTAGH